MQMLYPHSVTHETRTFSTSKCSNFQQTSTSSSDCEQLFSVQHLPANLEALNPNKLGQQSNSSTKPRVDLTKQKSELCRTFLQKGYCPYNQKCKFAHGCHQLRQNQEFNSRYKTKQCGAFFKKGFCCYGDRCNFVHSRQEPETDRKDKWALIKKNNRQLVMETRRESRLMQVLGYRLIADQPL